MSPYRPTHRQAPEGDAPDMADPLMRLPTEAYNRMPGARHEWEPYPAETMLQRLERLIIAYREAHHGKAPKRIVMTPEAVTDYFRGFGPGTRQIFTVSEDLARVGVGGAALAFHSVPIVEELDVPGDIRMEP